MINSRFIYVLFSSLLFSILALKANPITDMENYHAEIKTQVQKLCNEKKYQKSLEYCIHEIEIAQKENDLIRESIAVKLLGTTFYHMGRPKEAKREWTKAIDLSEKGNVPLVSQNCYSNLGALALEASDFNLAEKYFLQSLNYANKRKNEGISDYLNTLRLLASMYGETKQYNKADSIFTRLINNPNTSKNISSFYTAKVFYSRILVASGQWQKGISLSDSCLKEARKIDNFDLLTTVMSLHIGNLVELKRFEEAFNLNRELEQLSNQRNAKVIDKNISDSEIKFNTSQIAYEKEMSELKSKKEREQLIYLSIGSIIIIVASFIFIIQRKKIASSEIIQQEKIIALIEGEEKERTRVAKDLHDGIVQNLTALKMNLQAVPTNGELGKIELDKIGSEIDLLNQEIRSIAYQMMPVTLKELGLPKALEDVFARNLKNNQIEFHFEAIGFDSRLPEMIEVNLFRIGQELLNNILKHSLANSVELLLVNRNQRIQFILEDNGKGMPIGKIKEGIGMNSISTRLSAILGKIIFEPRTDGGTMVSIQVPLA